MLEGFEDKTASAVCTLAFHSGEKDSEVILFQGITPGTIVHPRGPTDFGWDPCFQPKGYDKTYAELPKETKNSISPRGKAVEKLKAYFTENDKGDKA